MPAKLALEDGTIFTGVACGAPGTRAGEVVFNTAMTGYQEIFTDPSYCGQIVTMTFPQIGNCGVNADDFESVRPALAGVVVKQLPPRPSNYRATEALADFLQAHDIVGIANVDTRAVTRRTRLQGALRGVVSTEIIDPLELLRMARAAEPMSGSNLVERVVTTGRGDWTEPLWTPPRVSAPAAEGGSDCHIVALDCGIKHNILRYLVEQGCRVSTISGSASAADIRALGPDGLLIGNGPGDPAAVTGTVATLRELLGAFPMFGVCLGHQLLALALGATTYKLAFGHHGANLPVLNKTTGRVEITSQNHGFCVELKSLEQVGGTVTHVNLNDGSLEGFAHREHDIVAVQFHPEASPGPHDAGYMFARFARAVASGKGVAAGLFAV
jgi:carbamoyl-phosphate synthase small subunit